ncbi:MAG TPA: hypothetical protein VHE99_00465 [Gammaproteobacteria bacterium]|nr:hypothetical protein [Gammaproteobacteria bacterium]
MTIASQRIVVQVTPKQKKEIAAVAKRVGLNTSELMRQAAQQFVPHNEKEDIELLLQQIERSTREAGQALDQALAFIMQSDQRIKNLQERSH